MPARAARFDGLFIAELYGIFIIETPPSSTGGSYGGLSIGGNFF